MRRLYSLLSFLSLALAGGMHAFGQTDLQFRWQEGDEWVLTRVLDATGTLRVEGGQPLSTSQHVIIQKKVSVQKVDGLGNAQLHAALLTISGTREVAGSVFRFHLSPDRITFDDTRLWEAGKQTDATSAELERSLRETFRSWVIWCAPHGQTNHPTQPEEIRQQASHSDLFTLFGIGQEGWIALPDFPARAGDTWKDETPDPIRSGTSEVWQASRYALDALDSSGDSSIASISFHQRKRSRNLAFSYAPRVEDKSDTTQAFVYANEQEFSGQVRFDATRGYVLSCECEGTASMRYSVDEPVLFSPQPAVLQYEWNRIRMKTDWEKTTGIN